MEHWDHNTCRGLEELGFAPILITYGVVTSVSLLLGFSFGVI